VQQRRHRRFLGEGVAWYAAPQLARSVVVLLRRTQRFRVLIVFVDLPVSTLVFLSFLCLFLGLVVLWPQLVRCIIGVFYINIAGRKPISRSTDDP
jgi:hypothetical protein